MSGGLEVVLLNREALTLDRKTVKNSTGYSFKHLIVGSEGTLIVIATSSLSFRLFLRSLFPFESIDLAMTAVSLLVCSPVNFTAVEFMERETILFSEEYLGKHFPDTKSPAYLLLTVDGSDPAVVQGLYRQSAELCLALGARDVYRGAYAGEEGCCLKCP